MSTTATAGFSRIARCIVPVSDMDRALAFYRDKLGFDVVADVPFGDGDRWIELQPPGGGPTVAPGPPMSGKIGVPTGISLVADDVDALHATLKERGVDVDPEVVQPAPETPRMFWFRDQDGNTLHVADA